MLLSKECTYVAVHRPEKFLGMLRDIFDNGNRQPFSEEKFMKELKVTPVLCQSGEKLPLSTVYLPFPKLKNRYKDFAKHENFPFLFLPPFPRDNEDNFLGWSFLGLKDEDTVDFRLNILKYIKKEYSDPSYLEDPTQIIRLYQLIENACVEGSDSAKNQKTIRQTFIKDSLILIPKTVNNKGCWVSPEKCLLDAPNLFNVVCALQCCYEEAFSKSVFKISLITEFFSTILKV
ncbi:hypothetical protein F5884DRAFT_243494 [Xylogone sp. PMI_703]|nr:hypothetical protein F5884DRAFT_243494 [Xylogone sp. PMI_703]